MGRRRGQPSGGRLTPQMPPSRLLTGAPTATRAANSAALSTRAKLLIVRNIAKCDMPSRSDGPRVGQTKCSMDAGGPLLPVCGPPDFLSLSRFRFIATSRDHAEFDAVPWTASVAAAPCLIGLTLRLESFSKTRLDDIPWVATVRVGVEIAQALRVHFSVPLRDVDRRSRRRDSTPQQREIVDLLVGRQVVESRRRKGDWCGHRCSTRNNLAQYTGARGVQLKWSHEA